MPVLCTDDHPAVTDHCSSIVYIVKYASSKGDVRNKMHRKKFINTVQNDVMNICAKILDSGNL